MIASQKIGKSFMGALNYNLKKLNHPDPQLRAELLATNFADLDPALIKQEVELMKSMKPNLSRYVYHTSLNFANEDTGQLDSEKLLAIANEYLTQSGYTNNQYMVFRHHDADHPHIHLLVNRICFDGTVVSDSNNFKKSEAILRGLETKYGLTQVQGSQKAENRAVKKGELERIVRTGKPSDKMLLQEKMKAILRLPNLTIPEMIELGKKEGIYFLFNQASTGRVTGITYFHGDFKIKGQALGNQFKWIQILKKVAYEQNRDRQAISEANHRTRAAYGELEPVTAEERTSSEQARSAGTRSEQTSSQGTSLEQTRSQGTNLQGTRSPGTSSGRTDHPAAAQPDGAEFAEGGRIDQRGSGRPGEDLAEDQPAGTASGAAESGMETAAEVTDANRVLLDHWGNRYIPPFAVGLANDEDDALRRRKRQGIGR